MKLQDLTQRASTRAPVPTLVRRTTLLSVWVMPLCMSGCGANGSNGSASTQMTTSSTSSSATNGYEPTRDVPDEVATGTAPLFNGEPPEIIVSDASAEPDVSDALLQTCTPATGTGDTPMIDDFEDGDETLSSHEGLSGGWYKYEESAGDHHISVVELAEPRLDSHWAVSTGGSDHGAWAGIGVSLNYGCVYDASRYVGVHFWIRGTSDPVNVALLTPGVIPYSQGGTCTQEEEGLCWDAYRSLVTVTPQWREVFVPFSSFSQLGYGPDAGPIDLTRLESIQFQSDVGPFDFWVDDLSFYVEEVYTPFDAGTETVDVPSDSTTSESSPLDAGTSGPGSSASPADASISGPQAEGGTP